MPEIPLFVNESRLGQLPGPVLDREARPRVDAGSLIAGVGRMAEAAQGSSVYQYLGDLSADDFGGASAKALSSLGQGIGELAGVVSALAEREMEVRNYTHLSEAKAELELFEHNFESDYIAKNPNDPDGWRTEWLKQREHKVAEMKQRGYSRLVHDQLERYYPEWNARSEIRVDTLARRSTFEKGRRAATMGLDQSIARGDPKAVKQALTTVQKVTGASNEQMQKIEADSMSRMNASVIEKEISNNPKEVLEMLSAPREFWMKPFQDMAPEEEENVRLRAETSWEHVKGSAYQQIHADAASGQLTSADQLRLQFDTGLRDEKGILSSQERSTIIKTVFGGKSNDAASLHQLTIDIHGYDNEADKSGLQQARLFSRVYSLTSGDQQMAMLDLLSKRGKPGAMNQDDVIHGEVTQGLMYLQKDYHDIISSSRVMVKSDELELDSKTGIYFRVNPDGNGTVSVSLSKDDRERLQKSTPDASGIKSIFSVTDEGQQMRAYHYLTQRSRTLQKMHAEGKFTTGQDVIDAVSSLRRGVKITTPKRPAPVYMAPLHNDHSKSVEANKSLQNIRAGKAGTSATK